MVVCTYLLEIVSWFYASLRHSEAFHLDFTVLGRQNTVAESLESSFF